VQHDGLAVSGSSTPRGSRNMTCHVPRFARYVNDADARHTCKSQQARRDGYRAHVAAGPDTGIITDEKLTRASGQDNADPAVAGSSWTPRAVARRAPEI
jgi:hypothetical protein